MKKQKQLFWDTMVLSLYRPARFLGIFLILVAALTMQQLAPADVSAPLEPDLLPATAALMALFLGGWLLFQYASRHDGVSFLKKNEQRVGERLFLYEAVFCESCGKKRIAVHKARGDRGPGSTLRPILPGEEVPEALRGYYCPHCGDVIAESGQARRRIRPLKARGRVRLRTDSDRHAGRYRLQRSVVLSSFVMMVIVQAAWLLSLRALLRHFYMLLLCLITSYLLFNFVKLFLTNAVLRYEVGEEGLLIRRVSGVRIYPWDTFQEIVRYTNLKKLPDRIAFFTEFGNFFIPQFIENREALEAELIARSNVRVLVVS